MGIIVPRALRSSWRQEWEAEIVYRENQLARWDKLDRTHKWDLLRRSLGAFWDAVRLQPRRLEDEMFQDVFFGLRMLRRSPVVSIVAILSLAAGIGANTLIFSVVNALLIRPLPYRSPEQLVKVFQAQPDPSKGMLPSLWSYPRYEVMHEHNQVFSSVAAFSQTPYNLTGTDSPERLQVEIVSDSYFSLLGVDPALGRAFSTDENQASAIIGYGFWQRRFGGETNVLGKTLEIDNNLFTIVGVAPRGFRGQSGTADTWVTMMAAPLLRFKNTLKAPNNYWFHVIARVKENTSPAAITSDLARVGKAIEERYPSPGRSFSPAAAPFQSSKVDPAIKRTFLVLLAAVGLVLLIACANTANLLLARALSRQREFAVRSALGAGRLRIIRQLITENIVLAVIGGIIGVLVARGGLELLKTFRPSDRIQYWSEYARAFDFFSIDLDWRVLIFNFVLALATGLLFGLLPAIQAAFRSVNESLSASFRRPWFSARGLLVAGEMALALVLLIGAGLMIRSLSRLQSVSLGFVPDNVVTMAAPSRHPLPGFYDQLLERVRNLPGVEAASIAGTAPLLGYNSKTVMDIEERSDARQVGVGLHSVSPDYFKTLGIPLLQGRAFGDHDREGAPRVAIINQAAADRFFAGISPIGKRVRPYIDPDYETSEKSVEIVGIVGNVMYGRLEEPIEPDIYLSSLQPTDTTGVLIVRSPSLQVASLTETVRNEVLKLDRNVPLTSVQTMRERASEITSRTRFMAFALGLFSVLAVLLSAIGIYGVMAYSMSARTHELGIRIALGAQPRDVLQLVLRDGVMIVGLGLLIGIPAAFASTKILKSQLFGVNSTDPLVFALVAITLSAVAMLASFVPARRAMRADPLKALRYE